MIRCPYVWEMKLIPFFEDNVMGNVIFFIISQESYLEKIEKELDSVIIGSSSIQHQSNRHFSSLH